MYLNHYGTTKSAINRSSRRRCSFLKKGVLKNFAKFTGEQLYQGLFFNKIAGSACNLKNRLWHKCFPVNFAHLFDRTPPVDCFCINKDQEYHRRIILFPILKVYYSKKTKNSNSIYKKIKIILDLQKRIQSLVKHLSTTNNKK